jgi:catechol 2,3-dioxygenase-like lactoylglutathione lyase family enzyme
MYPRMHVSLYVSNIEKTVTFYDQFFGVEALKVKPGYAKYILESPSLIISFVENPARVQSNFGHLGFQVESVKEVMQRLEAAKAAELSVREEMGVSCCFALQDKFWVNDPDGHQWEIYYFHEDSEFNDPHYNTVDASACCMPTGEKKKMKLSELGSKKCC